MAKISIIMGVYNCAAYLREAVDSILRQTCEDWTLIMCDDGSKDDSYTVAQSYVERYPEKIILIRNEKNMGLNFTLNHCLQYADSEYVARMDGDDVSLPDRLERELAFLEAHPEYDIVSSPMLYFDESGVWGRGRACEKPAPENFIKGTPFCHAPCMVRKQALDSVGWYSREPWTARVEDYDLWFRMYAKGSRGYNISEPLYMMRDDENAYARRRFRYAVNEMRVRRNGYRLLGIPLSKRVYAFRPIAVWLLPKALYMRLHHKKKRGS